MLVVSTPDVVVPPVVDTRRGMNAQPIQTQRPSVAPATSAEDIARALYAYEDFTLDAMLADFSHVKKRTR